MFYVKLWPDAMLPQLMQSQTAATALLQFNFFLFLFASLL